MELIKFKKKFKKSYFGAFPGLKEFDRHEGDDDRTDDPSFPRLQKTKLQGS